jgi:hypothetical protein
MSLACDEVKRMGVPVEEPMCRCSHRISEHVQDSLFGDSSCRHSDWWDKQSVCGCGEFVEVGK